MFIKSEELVYPSLILILLNCGSFILFILLFTASNLSSNVNELFTPPSNASSLSISLLYSSLDIVTSPVLFPPLLSLPSSCASFELYISSYAIS